MRRDSEYDQTMSTLKRLLDIATFANGGGQISLEEMADSSEGTDLKLVEPDGLTGAQPIGSPPALRSDSVVPIKADPRARKPK
jgi:hypothetical protein